MLTSISSGSLWLPPKIEECFPKLLRRRERCRNQLHLLDHREKIETQCLMASPVPSWSGHTSLPHSNDGIYATIIKTLPLLHSWLYVSGIPMQKCVFKEDSGANNVAMTLKTRVQIKCKWPGFQFFLLFANAQILWHFEIQSVDYPVRTDPFIALRMALGLRRIRRMGEGVALWEQVWFGWRQCVTGFTVLALSFKSPIHARCFSLTAACGSGCRTLSYCSGALCAPMFPAMMTMA